MAFLETPRFDDNISYASRGGPMFNTTVVRTNNKSEFRNQNWTYPIHQYDVSFGAKRLNLMADMLEFFWAVGGRLNGFRYKDWTDFKSCSVDETVAFDDQEFGTGDGSTTQFQLSKTYTKGALSFTRNIYKPIASGFLIGVNGSATGSGWSLDTTTGVVTFSVAPTDTHVLTWGGEFDVPVRFDSDFLDMGYDDYDNLNADIRLIELLIAPTL